MPRKKAGIFTDRELTFMNIIWEKGEVTADDILKVLEETNDNPISSGSIRNILSVMMDKGYIERRQEGKSFYYSAKVKKTEAGRSMLRYLIDKVFDGSESNVIAALFDRKRLPKREFDRIKKLINED
jgi:BlaI family transcriptional regulator, penicillinase repressor